MYSYITGVVEEKTENILVISCNNIGYEIYASSTTLNSLEIGGVATIYTYLHVREDAFMLFGFSSKEEKNMFLELITVSGIGAKMALQMLSGASVNTLMKAIITGDIKLISSLKGIGKKTAERIVLELRGKFGDISLGNIEVTDLTGNFATTLNEEAIQLLTNMGLTRMEAQNLVKQVSAPNDTLEEIITKALRNMS